MADNEQDPGHDEAEGGSPPSGDFPADFFDDGPESSPVSLTPREPSSDQPNVPPPPPFPPSPPADEPPPMAAAAPSSYKAPAFIPEENDDLKMSAFPTILGVAMIGVLVAAWFVSRQTAGASAAEPSPSPASAAAAPAPVPVLATIAITDALEGKVNGVAGKLDEMAARVKAVEGKLDGLPEPEPAPDLKPLEGKLDELGKAVAAVAPLNDRVGKLGDRFGAVDDELKSIKSELAALKDEFRKAAEAAARPAAEPKPAADATATALAGGVDLFKAGKYKEADDVFKNLAAGNPKDARVYYYAALTRGLTTNDWQGETLATASRGADLEKAGTTKPSDVDAAFADLPATLKPWIAFFRKQAK